MEPVELSDYLEKRAESVQALWQSHTDEITDWKKHIIRYQQEGLRWLVAVAVAILGISRFSSTSATGNDWHAKGLMVLVFFVVGAVGFDMWRSRRAWNIQVVEGRFAETKLGALRVKIGKWQEDDIARKALPEPLAMHNQINADLSEWLKGRPVPCLEQVGNWFEGTSEKALLLCFVAGVTMYFLP